MCTGHKSQAICAVRLLPALLAQYGVCCPASVWQNSTREINRPLYYNALHATDMQCHCFTFTIRLDVQYNRIEMRPTRAKRLRLCDARTFDVHTILYVGCWTHCCFAKAARNVPSYSPSNRPESYAHRPRPANQRHDAQR